MAARFGPSGTLNLVVERRRFFAAFDPPYIVGEVQLAQGPRMPVKVALEHLERLRIGLHGQIEFRLAANALTLPQFSPDDETART